MKISGQASKKMWLDTGDEKNRNNFFKSLVLKERRTMWKGMQKQMSVMCLHKSMFDLPFALQILQRECVRERKENWAINVRKNRKEKDMSFLIQSVPTT